jgi:hypothetical protein
LEAAIESGIDVLVESKEDALVVKGEHARVGILPLHI